VPVHAQKAHLVQGLLHILLPLRKYCLHCIPSLNS
jgi:hypothetical protein